MAVPQTKVLKTSQGHHYPPPALPQPAATVSAPEQEASRLLPATEVLHMPVAHLVPLFASNLRAPGFLNVNRPPVLPNTGLQKPTVGYLWTLPLLPTKERGNPVRPL